LVYKWIDETSEAGNKNSVRLSIEIVPPETKHYIAYNSYQTSPKPRFFINLEYQEGSNAALLDSVTIKTNSANEY